jgi:hypothetical protein
LLSKEVHLAFEIGEEDMGARAFGEVEIKRLRGVGMGSGQKSGGFAGGF